MKFAGIETVNDWPKIRPEDNLVLGQVSGIAVDANNHVHVFHRGSRVWDARFDLLRIWRHILGGDALGRPGGCKIRLNSFSCQISYNANKPGISFFVIYLCYSIFWFVDACLL